MADRHRYVVRAFKLPPQQRDIAAPVLAQSDAGYEPVFGSEDDGPDAGAVGEPVAYVAHLTEDERRRFETASNLRSVELDDLNYAQVVEVIPVEMSAHTPTEIPGPVSLGWLGFPDGVTAPGRDGEGVVIAVLDGGTTAAVRERMGLRVVGERNFSGVDPGPDGITTEHGCLVTPNCVPPRAQLLEAIISNDQGQSWSSAFAAAVRWAVDNGANVINYSYGGSGGSSVQQDAIAYARDRGVMVFASAGNDGQHALAYPAAWSRQYPNMHSSIAFREDTDLRASFSNYHEDGSGCAPGYRVLSLNKDGELIRWSGTSASSPMMAYIAAALCSNGRHRYPEVSTALKATARDTPATRAEEGLGAWHLQRALAVLQPPPAPTPPPEPAPTPEPLPIPEPAPAPWAFYSTRFGSRFHRRGAHFWLKPHRTHPTREEAIAAQKKPCSWCKP